MKRISLIALALSFIMMSSIQGNAGDLHDAAQNGDIVKVRQLIEQGVDVNARDKDQNTPLDYAAWRGGNTDVVKLLIEKGANVNEVGEAGPLHLAARTGRTDVAKLLIEKGADVNARDNIRQWTPLHEAANFGNTEVAKLLIEKGADVNAKDKWQSTPAMVAEQHNHVEFAAMLRKQGGGSVRQDFDALVKKVASNVYVTISDEDLRTIVRLARTLNPPPTIPQIARDEMVKGMAAFRLAKRPEDFKEAEEHFDKASHLAPWLPEPYFNLALVQEKMALTPGAAIYLNIAKYSLEKYLIAVTDPKDIQAGKQKMAEIEAQQELQEKREAAIKVKYGNRQGGGFGFDDLFRYGAVVQNMSFDASGNERTISLKISTRKEGGYLRTYYQVFDITSKNDTFGQKFSIDWSGTQTFWLDDRGPNQDLMTLTVTPYGDGDANITIRPANNASATIKTSLTALLRELASQAVYAGDKINIGGRDFYVLGQGGAKGSLMFFPPEIKDRIEHGNARDLMPALVANVNYRGSDGQNKNWTSSDLGDVKGTHYHLEFVGGYWEAKVGRGEDH
jgi:hypothetical protein